MIIKVFIILLVVIVIFIIFYVFFVFFEFFFDVCIIVVFGDYFKGVILIMNLIGVVYGWIYFCVFWVEF